MLVREAVLHAGLVHEVWVIERRGVEGLALQ
jgi:hypothetical protein